MLNFSMFMHIGFINNQTIFIIYYYVLEKKVLSSPKTKKSLHATVYLYFALQTMCSFICMEFDCWNLYCGFYLLVLVAYQYCYFRQNRTKGQFSTSQSPQDPGSWNTGEAEGAGQDLILVTWVMNLVYRLILN